MALHQPNSGAQQRGQRTRGYPREREWQRARYYGLGGTRQGMDLVRGDDTLQHAARVVGASAATRRDAERSGQFRQRFGSAVDGLADLALGDPVADAHEQGGSPPASYSITK